jgi:hypothetical protein
VKGQKTSAADNFFAIYRVMAFANKPAKSPLPAELNPERLTQ